jgi:hypothetical protein
VQGFRTECGSASLENTPGTAALASAAWPSAGRLIPRLPIRVTTPTFILPEDLNMRGYSLIASPTLYPGQTLRAGLWADETNPGAVQSRLVVRYYDADDQPAIDSWIPEFTIEPGAVPGVHWHHSDLPGMPIFAAGFEAARTG